MEKLLTTTDGKGPPNNSQASGSSSPLSEIESASARSPVHSGVVASPMRNASSSNVDLSQASSVTPPPSPSRSHSPAILLEFQSEASGDNPPLIEDFPPIDDLPPLPDFTKELDIVRPCTATTPSQSSSSPHHEVFLLPDDQGGLPSLTSELEGSKGPFNRQPVIKRKNTPKPRRLASEKPPVVPPKTYHIDSSSKPAAPDPLTSLLTQFTEHHDESIQIAARNMQQSPTLESALFLLKALQKYSQALDSQEKAIYGYPVDSKLEDLIALLNTKLSQLASVVDEAGDDEYLPDNSTNPTASSSVAPKNPPSAPRNPAELKNYSLEECIAALVTHPSDWARREAIAYREDPTNRDRIEYLKTGCEGFDIYFNMSVNMDVDVDLKNAQDYDEWDHALMKITIKYLDAELLRLDQIAAEEDKLDVCKLPGFFNYNREQARGRLAGAPVGTYIIRPSSNQGGYAISMRVFANVEHAALDAKGFFKEDTKLHVSDRAAIEEFFNNDAEAMVKAQAYNSSNA